MVTGLDSDANTIGKIVFYSGGTWPDCMRLIRLLCAAQMKTYGTCCVDGEMKGVKYVMLESVGVAVFCDK